MKIPGKSGNYVARKSNKKAQQRWEKLMQSNYGVPTLDLKKGKGLYLWDVEGTRYLDFLGGIATNILGHAHPAVIKAVSKQIATLGHVSNFYMHEGVLHLAERLQKMTGDKSARVFFCNSGAEANEAALKLSRLTGRKNIVAAIGSFHGRTLGALSLTGQPDKTAPFKPLLKGIKHVPFGDLKALTRVINKRTAMVIVEPIMGEYGVVLPPAGYLAEARRLCDKNGALLAIDAVQSGMGRTGKWFGYEEEKITPDLITIAKGLGGGLPLGAMIALGKSAHLLQPGQHGTTFGGNPVSCAAANAVLDVMEKKKLLKNSAQMGRLLLSSLAPIAGVLTVRGRGLLIGIVLEKPEAKEITRTLQENGVLVNAAKENVIRIAPALIVSKKEIQEFVDIFRKVMAESRG